MKNLPKKLPYFAVFLLASAVPIWFIADAVRRETRSGTFMVLCMLALIGYFLSLLLKGLDKVDSENP